MSENTKKYLKIAAVTTWMLAALCLATFLHWPLFLETIFPQKKWVLTHVLKDGESLHQQARTLLARTPALDLIEQVLLTDVANHQDLQTRLKAQGYQILQNRNINIKNLPEISFFMITSHSGQPVYAGDYQGPTEELNVARSFYGKSRQTFYAGFSCGETVALQSTLSPQKHP